MGNRHPYPLHTAGLHRMQREQRERLRLLENATLQLESAREELARTQPGHDPYNRTLPSR